MERRMFLQASASTFLGTVIDPISASPAIDTQPEVTSAIVRCITIIRDPSQAIEVRARLLKQLYFYVMGSAQKTRAAVLATCDAHGGLDIICGTDPSVQLPQLKSALFQASNRVRHWLSTYCSYPLQTEGHPSPDPLKQLIIRRMLKAVVQHKEKEEINKNY